MKNFSHWENCEIATAFQVLRASILLAVLRDCSDSEKRNSFSQIFGAGKKIHQLIGQFQWPELFADKKTGELLSMATQFASLNPIIDQQLKVVCRSFPEEMKKLSEESPEIGFYLSQVE